MEATRHRLLRILLLALSVVAASDAQTEGKAALEAFRKWQSAPANTGLSYSDAMDAYRKKLQRDGLTPEAAERTMRLIEAYDEGEFYSRIYSEPPQFNTGPNQLLVDAVKGVTPGTALDVGMGAGRNSIYLARNGWSVTGFDVAAAGLKKAEEQAAASGVKVRCVLASDEEFDFGRARWDLIAIIYAIEKRSVHRVAEALKPGGILVIEAGHKETSGAQFEYETNELLRIFAGFRILRYEDTAGHYDWGNEKIRLVRLVAQKPR